MPYISSVERIGYKRGGCDAGKTEGITQGRIEAIELGLSLKSKTKDTTCLRQ